MKRRTQLNVEQSNQTNQVFDVGGPEDLSWNQIAAICFEVLGRRPRIIHLPLWLLRGMLTVTRALSPTGYVQTHNTTAARLGSRTLWDFLTAETRQRMDEKNE